MKNYLFIASVSLFLLSACNSPTNDSKSVQHKDSMLMVLSQRDSFINNLIVSFNEVESNLDSVAAKQRLIYLNTAKGTDIKANQKEHINSMIAGINDIMNENKAKIAELSKKLNASSNKNNELQKLITSLNNQLAQKNNELFQLNEKLNALNLHVAKLEANLDSMSSQNYMQSIVIARETKTIQTAYYIIGKTKELKEANIIDKKGGLLGMGKTSKLNSDFDEKKFTKIDYTKTKEIIINSSDAKIITSHPSDSYTLDKGKNGFVKNLIITNPEKFWKASKFLVVQLD